MNAEKESSYRYVLLRYVHDRRTEEFVNVGVVLECTELGFLACKVDGSLSRLSGFFPGAHVTAIRAVLRAINTRVTALGDVLRHYPVGILPSEAGYLERVWREIFPRDESALAWSQVKAGVARNPADALERIYSRTVLPYKNRKDRGSRSDDDVWSVVEPHLARYALSQKLVEHHVRSQLSEYRFEHSLKNGRWHCIEPISIDLMNGENIRGKVQKLYGAMSLISGSTTDTQVYFVLSDPTTDAAKDMFNEARDVLSSVLVPHDVFLESQAGELAEQLASIAH